MRHTTTTNNDNNDNNNNKNTYHFYNSLFTRRAQMKEPTFRHLITREKYNSPRKSLFFTALYPASQETPTIIAQPFA